jgi:hypothetical protein
MQDELSEMLGGYPIDLVTPKFRNHRIRDRVLSDSELIYAGCGNLRSPRTFALGAVTSAI